MFHFSTIYLNTYPIYEQVSECLLWKMILAAIQATDQLLTATPRMLQISVRPSFSSLAPKDGSHWRPSLGYKMGVVTLLSSVGPLSLRFRCAVFGQMLLCKRITPSVSPWRFVHIAVLSLCSRLQYDAVFTLLPCSWNSTSITHVPLFLPMAQLWTYLLSAIPCASTALKHVLTLVDNDEPRFCRPLQPCLTSAL